MNICAYYLLFVHHLLLFHRRHSISFITSHFRSHAFFLGDLLLLLSLLNSCRLIRFRGRLCTSISMCIHKYSAMVHMEMNERRKKQAQNANTMENETKILCRRPMGSCNVLCFVHIYSHTYSMRTMAFKKGNRFNYVFIYIIVRLLL